MSFHLLGRVFLIALGILVSAEAATALTDEKIGTAHKVVGTVYGRSLLRTLQVGETLIANQRVRTGTASAADLEFLDETHLIIGAKTEVLLDEFVYNPNTNAAQGIINIVRGVLRFTSSANALDVKVKTRTATIGIRGTVFDVLESVRTTEIAVHEGTVQVDSPYGSVAVNAGEVLTISAAAGLPISNEASGNMRSAVSSMLAVVAANRANEAETEQTSRPENSDTSARAVLTFRDATRGRDLENLLYLDLHTGRVVIEMRPDLAPYHVARIKELVRSDFYDGLAFHNVVPGLVAQTGDPTGIGGGSGTTLTAELSDETFRRGSVGMRHERSRPDSADSQFFISTGATPQYDGRYTLWGQVIYGMELVDQLPPGRPPSDPGRIIRLRVAADLAD